MASINRVRMTTLHDLKGFKCREGSCLGCSKLRTTCNPASPSGTAAESAHDPCPSYSFRCLAGTSASGPRIISRWPATTVPPPVARNSPISQSQATLLGRARAVQPAIQGPTARAQYRSRVSRSCQSSLAANRGAFSPPPTLPAPSPHFPHRVVQSCVAPVR